MTSGKASVHGAAVKLTDKDSLHQFSGEEIIKLLFHLSLIYNVRKKGMCSILITCFSMGHLRNIIFT